MTKSGQAAALCPSAPAAPEAVLIGVIEPDGRVVNLTTPLPVDASFIERANTDAPLEARFRFSSPCAEGRCGYWTGAQCGLIGKLTQAVPPDNTDTLPPCAIRARCRWWRQKGREACAICSFVVTGTEAVPGGHIAPG
jgi:hypothetical protein